MPLDKPYLRAGGERQGGEDRGRDRLRERAPDVIVENNVDGEGVREVDEAALQSAWEESRDQQ